MPRPNVLPAREARKFAWAPVRRATGYSVEFLRDGRLVFHARTAAPRVVLPRTWRYHGRRMVLSSGRYTWKVHPQFGARTGRIVVRAEFVLAR